ncbi:MAG: hypothetical protein ACOYJ1_05920 [Peptococcales bacterium]|jgi:uncharacterized membrane protein
MFLKVIPLITAAYFIIFTGIVLKTLGLYFLVGRKSDSMEQRKKNYRYLNWPANILIFCGVIILAIKWYM